MEPITEGQVWKILSGHYEGWTVVILGFEDDPATRSVLEPMVKFRKQRRRRSYKMLAASFLERAERVS